MATPLKVIKPLTITDAILTATDVPETDYDAWAAGATYALGDRVIVDHMVYESAQSANTGNTPATAAEWWLEVGPTNRYRMFDDSVSRSTAQATAISVTLTPGQACNALAAINLAGCNSMRVRIVDATYGTLYDQTTDLSALPQMSNWWEWFFGTRVQPTQAVLLELPHIPTAEIIVDFAGGDDLAVGVLMIGSVAEIGIGVRTGASLGIQDYSRKETNEWGDTILAQRAFAKRARFDVPIESPEIDSALRLLTGLRATPALWIGSTQYESTVVYGFYKQFDVLIAYSSIAECSLEIEGLT